MPFCKELLVPYWNHNANLAKPKKSNKEHQKITKSVPFAMDIIITMCCCIWTERNAWIFNNVDPSVDNCKSYFKKEFTLVKGRRKDGHLICNLGCLVSLRFWFCLLVSLFSLACGLPVFLLFCTSILYY
jgi:hypothetical protein